MSSTQHPLMIPPAILQQLLAGSSVATFRVQHPNNREDYIDFDESQVESLVAAGHIFLSDVRRMRERMERDRRAEMEKEAASNVSAVLTIECGNCSHRWPHELFDGTRVVEQGGEVLVKGPDGMPSLVCPNCQSKLDLRVVHRSANIPRLEAKDWLSQNAPKKKSSEWEAAFADLRLIETFATALRAGTVDAKLLEDARAMIERYVSEAGALDDADTKTFGSAFATAVTLILRAEQNLRAKKVVTTSGGNTVVGPVSIDNATTPGTVTMKVPDTPAPVEEPPATS